MISRYLHNPLYLNAHLVVNSKSRRKVVGVNRSIRQLKARRYRNIIQAPVSARPYKLCFCTEGACPVKICTTLSFLPALPPLISFTEIHWRSSFSKLSIRLWIFLRLRFESRSPWTQLQVEFYNRRRTIIHTCGWLSLRHYYIVS